MVSDVSLKIKKGRIVGLLGPNGAGKTTTFYMMVGMIKPDSGRVELSGKDITSMPLYKRARQGVGYLPQEPSVFREMTAEDNIIAALELQRISGLERKTRAEDILREFGLLHVRNTLGGALSGGERRRVEIARAIAANPEFILLDEPFAGVDPKSIRELQDLIVQLKERGLGVLITDHNVRETLRITDYTYILNEGAVLHEGEPQAIAESEMVRRAYLGEDFVFEEGQ